MATDRQDHIRTRERIILDRTTHLKQSARSEDTALFGGRIVWGSRNAPPLYWEQQHNTAMQATLLTDKRRTGRIGRNFKANLPVPRSASCHYARPDQDARNFYFY